MARVCGAVLRLAGLVVGAAALSGASFQAPADFSGKWTLIVEPAGAGAGGGRGVPATAGSGWGREIAISQDATTLTIERPEFSRYDMQPPLRFIYALDGSESRNVITMGRGSQEQASRAVWKGTALVITTRHAPSGDRGAAVPAIEVTHVFSLDASGALVIETTRAAVGTGDATTTRARYQKG